MKVLVRLFSSLFGGRAFLHKHMTSPEAVERRQQARAYPHFIRELARLTPRINAAVISFHRDLTSLPTLVQEAERTLDTAEAEFAERAFVPFWNAVEQAASQLATFAYTLQQMASHSASYQEKRLYYEKTRRQIESISTPELRAAHPFPPLPQSLNTDLTVDAIQTAERMRRIVHAAQKDFHFASIYEQRKGNQILVAGFSTLGDAIQLLGNRLEASVERLGTQMRGAFDALAQAQRQATEEAAFRHEQTQKHQLSEREMLDNIQHRRDPSRPYSQNNSIDDNR